MKRNDLVEYDPGVTEKSGEWSRQHDDRREVEQTIKRYMDTDTDYWTPEERGDVPGTKELETGGHDVDTTLAELADGTT